MFPLVSHSPSSIPLKSIHKTFFWTLKLNNMSYKFNIVTDTDCSENLLMFKFLRNNEK